MDRVQEATNVVKDIAKFKNEEIRDYELIHSVCTYFDKVKSIKLNQSELKFLKYISNLAGIPHYYDTLQKFDNETEISDIHLNTISSLIFESTLHTTEQNKVHKYQNTILNLFEEEISNKYFLSASTSFGKTHLVYEIISKLNYKNVLLIFPTIALLSENLEKIISDENFNSFKEKYSIHTLSQISEFAENNLFIFTPERYLSFIEKNENTIQFDFVFVDEVYKMDNEYIIDEESKENERDVAYRLAIHYSLKYNADILLAGPYIEFENNGGNNSFNDFLIENEIKLLDFNNYEIVNKTYTEIKTSKSVRIDDEIEVNFSSQSKESRLISTLKALLEKSNESNIVYCASRSSVESNAKKILTSEILSNHNFSDYAEFIKHISNNFRKDWVVVNALKSGIGVHHSLVPKYIQKEIVNLFNSGHLKVLLSTTTITEGVNTSAKNLLVMASKKGTKELKKFDAKNIAGRAGRFLQHYSGRVIVVKNKFMDAINSEAEGIKHKNYDPNSPKDEIDLFYTQTKYLNNDDVRKLEAIIKKQSDRNIPESIFALYKVISRIDKIEIYDKIAKLNDSELESIRILIRKINFVMDIDYDGFQLIIDTIQPIVRNPKLKFLIEYKGQSNEYSTVTNLVHFYLVGGFSSSIRFKLQQGDNIDLAIRKTADFVYNTLKYQLVKYLGVFNIMYKFYLSRKNNIEFDDVVGIDKLLVKMEYNAFTDQGRLASDYGVPTNILNYYENETEAPNIRKNFDKYEEQIFAKVEAIINKNDA